LFRVISVFIVRNKWIDPNESGQNNWSDFKQILLWQLNKSNDFTIQACVCFFSEADHLETEIWEKQHLFFTRVERPVFWQLNVGDWVLLACEVDLKDHWLWCRKSQGLRN
jgi:hypothetical protein